MILWGAYLGKKIKTGGWKGKKLIPPSQGIDRWRTGYLPITGIHSISIINWWESRVAYVKNLRWGWGLSESLKINYLIAVCRSCFGNIWSANYVVYLILRMSFMCKSSYIQSRCISIFLVIKNKKSFVSSILKFFYNKLQTFHKFS